MWIAGQFFPFVVIICTTAAQMTPNCESGQINPTTNKTEYLAFTGEGGRPCTWFVDATPGHTVTVEIKKPEPSQGASCGITIFDPSSLFLECNRQQPYVSSGNQFILQYNITEFNVTYYLMLTPKTTDQETTLTTAGTTTAANSEASKPSDFTTTKITTGTKTAANSEASKPSDGVPAMTTTGTTTTAAASINTLPFVTVFSSIGLVKCLIEHRFGLY